MPDDYIPQDKNERRKWLDNLDDQLENETEDIGVTAAQKTAFHALRLANDDDALAEETARIAHDGSVTKSNASDAAATGLARTLVGIVQVNPNTTDTMRRDLQITIAKTTRTPVKVPTTVPVCTVDVSVTREHTLNFRDSATPDSKKKPDGVRSAQIWMFISDGAAPVGDKDFTYLADDSKTPYTHDFPMEEVGKTAFYMLRWVNTKGEVGPWSQVYSATIAG